MEHALVLTLVVITLLQLCRAQSTDSTPEWYAANDINDINFSPKPITELFSTETSFSPENPIVVLPPSTPLPLNRGVVSSPTPSAEYSDNTFPPDVIPLSSPEPPSSTTLSESTFSDTRPPSTPQRTSTISQQPGTTQSTIPSRTTQDILRLPNQQPTLRPRLNSFQNVRQNQPPTVPNRLPARPMQPQNIQFLLPPQVGSRNFNPGLPLPPNVGQPNYIVLYQQVPQNIQNMPPGNPQIPLQSFAPSSQASRPLRDPVPQQIAAPTPNVVSRPITQQPIQTQNQFITPNNIPPFNTSPQPNTQPPFSQQQNTGYFDNQQPNNQPLNDQATIYQQPDSQQLINQYPINQPPLQSNNFRSSPPYTPNNGPTITQRPRQRGRGNGGRLNNRGPNRTQAPNTFPCQGTNKTIVRPATTTPTKTQNPVITIRVKPSKGSRADLQNDPSLNTVRPTTVNPRRQNSQVNSRNYERCLNSCRDKKDRICATPESDNQINPDTLKGFPSMCHMACHNTFRANPIYGKITNGRCGKLRTRIQTVDKAKVRREDLKKSQYTIISNVPGTVLELTQ